MFPFHELDHIAQVVARGAEMSLRTSQWQGPRRIWREIAQVPILDEMPKFGDARMLLQSAEGCHPELPVILKFNKLSFF